jgi:hypothetical protein
MTEDIEHMKKLRFVYWQDDAFWLGYLEEFPEQIIKKLS